MQRSIFDGKLEFKIKKPLRLIELFAGYGSQSFSLKYLGKKFEHWKICEWAVKSIQAFKDGHFPNAYIDYAKRMGYLTKEDLVPVLHKYGISTDYNSPMTLKQINRKGYKWCKTVYNNIIETNNLVNIQTTKGKDLNIVDTDKYDYMMTYSFPCQDLSNAGKQKGMEKGSKTRSGMLWEVERLLDETDELPQIMLMENVPEVIGAKNAPHFAKWVAKLEKLGYKNYWQALNARHYGMPQNRNRVFMMSILGDYDYIFPVKERLELTLKDLLEENVSKDFYLSDRAIDYVLDMKGTQDGTKWEGSTKNGKLNRNVAMTIGCRSAASQRAGIPNFIMDGIYEEISVSKSKELINFKREVSNKLIESGKIKNGEFYDVSYSNSRLKELEKTNKAKVMNSNPKVAPTLTTSPQNFGMVVKSNKINKIGYYMPSKHNASVVVDERGIAPTVMENHGTVTAFMQKKNLKQELCDKLVDSKILRDGDVINHSYTNSSKNKASRLTLDDYIERRDGVSPCLTTRPDVLGYYENFSIRKLTPKECFRLMGIKDEDFERIAKNQSNASLYHLAGDSIVTNPLMALFKNLY